jgi:molybdopterin-guanine dinucleotide biosynthesis protein A
MLSRAPLLGLVLAGGESCRMGRDKATLIYSELSPLEQYQRHILSFESFNIETFLSCGRTKKYFSSQKVILDHKDFTGGPGAGLLSAHLFRKEAAWLVVACDFPFSDSKALSDLLLNRRANGVSTAYKNSKGVIEPLFAIWEPETLDFFLGKFKKGNKSPRDILEKTSCHTLHPHNSKVLVNINSPLEASERGLRL